VGARRIRRSGADRARGPRPRPGVSRRRTRLGAPPRARPPAGDEPRGQDACGGTPHPGGRRDCARRERVARRSGVVPTGAPCGRGGRLPGGSGAWPRPGTGARSGLVDHQGRRGIDTNHADHADQAADQPGFASRCRSEHDRRRTGVGRARRRSPGDRVARAAALVLLCRERIDGARFAVDEILSSMDELPGTAPDEPWAREPSPLRAPRFRQPRNSDRLLGHPARTTTPLTTATINGRSIPLRSTTKRT
jgi:hypothetical protein